jgi:hypothetical protein
VLLAKVLGLNLWMNSQIPVERKDSRFFSTQTARGVQKSLKKSVLTSELSLCFNASNLKWQADRKNATEEAKPG